MSAARDAWTQWAEKHPNPRAPLRNKYGARKVELDGIKFDSQREAARYAELRLMEAASLIDQLELRPAFALIVMEEAGPPWVFHTVGKYHADFRYRNLRTGEIVVEDVKSPPTRTTAYKLRKKLVEARYQITITEVE